MLRNLGAGRFVGLILLGICSTSGSWLRAQDNAPLDRGIAPNTTQNDGGDQPRQRVNRSGLTQPDLRSNGVGNDGEPVDPRIEELLQEWSEHTNQIKKLSGTHLRATRDFAFGTESWAEGKFYVETPDKGRIDVQPYSRVPPAKTVPRLAPNGQTVSLSIQIDSKHDRWICDGKEIKVIDDDHKTYDVVKIPPNQRGANIMDGPLPFLLGMPPDKAKARYRFKFIGQNKKSYAVEVQPRWKQDAVDWCRARLVLDRQTCLPSEVHLINAARTSETVYLFGKPEINQIRIVFWIDPFNPSLWTHTRSVHNLPDADPKTRPLGPGEMPSFVGMPYDAAKQNLQKLGYTNVKPARGDKATSSGQTYHVQSQQPPPYSKLEPQTEIILTIYDRMSSDTPNQKPARSADKPADGE